MTWILPLTNSQPWASLLQNVTSNSYSTPFTGFYEIMNVPILLVYTMLYEHGESILEGLESGTCLPFTAGC